MKVSNHDSYEQRLSIPVIGQTTLQFFTRSHIHCASGYDRVVIGGRGPYVEFDVKHLIQDSLSTITHEHYYYIELRTNVDHVKVYAQLHRVDYADYIPGKFYISPFDLYDEHGNVLITPLKRGKIV
jgi:hypothetical protein